jgi:signal transduction histidine kinase
VLRNLLSNANRFNLTGSTVRVSVQAARIGEGAAVVPAVRVSVEDNGVGFPDAERCRGAGLGLAICREIVSRHQGVIQAQATGGGGATIVMFMPGEPLSHKSDSVHDKRRDIA